MKIYKVLRIPLIILAAVVLAGVVGWVIIGRGCGDQPQPPKTKAEAPPGREFAPVVETPLIGRNVASERTRDYPPGSKVVVVKRPGVPEVEVGILPGGEVVVPEGVEATVYVKREAFAAAQVRPFVGVGVTGPELYAAGAVGVDFLRVWKVNLGAGALINDRAVAGAAFGAVPVWRNVDARVGGGYGTDGAVAFVGVSIGIE